MDDTELIPVSPRHSVRLAGEYRSLIHRAPDRDYVVRTLSRREAGGLPLMTAELVIAGAETRKAFPLAVTYPLHFRKTYFPGRFHGDAAREFQRHARATELIRIPPPIGCSGRTIRGCFIPGKPYSRLSPFGVEPEERNLELARQLNLAQAAGLWRMMEEAFAQMQRLHAGGLTHGDAELHNLIVCPAPLELVLIDFESATLKGDDAADWETRCGADLRAILREAVFLQCALGRQAGALAEMACLKMDGLMQAPARFRREIEVQARIGHGGRA